MNFTEPLPLADILARLDAKTPIGSVLRTAEWERMPQVLRESAFFSAGVTEAAFLAQQQQSIRDIIARAKGVNENGGSYWKMDRSRFIKDLRLLGESLGIRHPADKREGGVVKEHDITDPISIARLKLVVNTQLEMAYGEGQWRTAMEPGLLNEWPAWEFVRISPRKVPRRWLERWQEAADAIGWEGVSREAFKQGRMIALKTSGIWLELSRFQRPFPPFDFNSGMGVEDVPRADAAKLGLLGQEGHDTIQPDVKAFEDTLEMSVKGLPETFKKSLSKVFGDQISFDGDTARWRARSSFKQPPAFEPSKGGGKIEVDEALAKIIHDAALNDAAVTHGPSKPLDVNEDAAQIIRVFEQRIRGMAREHAKLYDSDGAEVDSRVGTAEKVSFPSALCREAIMTHRHPNGTPPGMDDLVAMLQNEMKEVRAVADDGVFSIRPGNTTGNAALIETLRAFRLLDPSVDAILSRLHKANAWSDEGYARRYLRAMYSALAERGLLSYSFEPFTP